MADETEETIIIGRRMLDTGEYRDRYDYDRYKILLNALEAWRVNPLARRGIELTTQFVVGKGIEITAPAPADKFLNDWQAHPANQIQRQIPEWADELWRAGNLFLLGAVDPAGMLYLRPCPAELIDQYETYANDPYRPKRITLNDLERQTFPAYRPGARQRKFFLHYTINRPAGAQWGESDLAPVLRYVSLYTDWLIDRAAVNKYMQPSYVVKKRFTDDDEKKAFADSITPPRPGSTTVADPDENWTTLENNINALDAGPDGLAIKKMIAAGLGFPLHYLAEPESSTSTTAESAGTPTYRRLLSRQVSLINMLKSISTIALQVRSTFTGESFDQEVTISAPDISERDNAQMAIAANRIASALAPYFDNLGAEEVIRMIYRFAGEPAMPKINAKARPLTKSAPDVVKQDEQARQEEDKILNS